jgi:hypothetical protein
MACCVLLAQLVCVTHASRCSCCFAAPLGLLLLFLFLLLLLFVVVVVVVVGGGGGGGGGGVVIVALCGQPAMGLAVLVLDVSGLSFIFHLVSAFSSRDHRHTRAVQAGSTVWQWVCDPTSTTLANHHELLAACATHSPPPYD